MHQIDIAKARVLCVEVAALKERLHRAGLYKTGHAMEVAVTAVGYEVAEHIEHQERGQ